MWFYFSDFIMTEVLIIVWSFGFFFIFTCKWILLGYVEVLFLVRLSLSAWRSDRFQYPIGSVIGLTRIV